MRADKLFLTGDFRDASKQDDSEENAEKVARFIFEIAKIVGIRVLLNLGILFLSILSAWTGAPPSRTP